MPMSNAMLSEKSIATMNKVLHDLMHSLHLHQLEVWSEQLQGMTPSELHLVKLVADRPDIIVKEIKTAMQVPGSTLTSIINRLEHRKILRRVITSRDRRSYGLELTDTGHAVHAAHMDVDRMIASTVLATLEQHEDREILLRLLTRVTERLATSSSK